MSIEMHYLQLSNTAYKNRIAESSDSQILIIWKQVFFITCTLNGLVYFLPEFLEAFSGSFLFWKSWYFVGCQHNEHISLYLSLWVNLINSRL